MSRQKLGNHKDTQLDTQPKKPRMADTVLLLAIIAQTLLIPIAILGPFYTGQVHFVYNQVPTISSRNPVFFAVIATLLVTIFLWAPRLKGQRKRGYYLLTQLLASLTILSPTLWLYGIMHRAAEQQYQHDVLTSMQLGGNGGGFPLYPCDWFCGHQVLSLGISPSTVILLWLFFVLVPAIGCYQHFLSKKRISGIKKIDLFQ